MEAASAAGDTIYVMQSPSADVLDGGIQLKDGQRLIGLGPSVKGANPNSARAKLTNSSDARYDGDIVRLARNNVVQNIHFDYAYRTSVFGINADNAVIRDNLMTNDMAVAVEEGSTMVRVGTALFGERETFGAPAEGARPSTAAGGGKAPPR